MSESFIQFNVRKRFPGFELDCAAEFGALTPYMYSCYEGDGRTPAECEADPSDRA